MFKISSILKRFLLVFIAIIFALILAEASFILFPILKNKYSIEKFISHSPAEIVLNKVPRLYRPSNILGYEPVPNCRDEINSYGVLADEFSIEKTEDEFRILILGDSIAEQNYFVDYLTEYLSDFNSINKFQLINAGVGGYQVWNYRQFLKYKGLAFYPDIIIINLCLNDFNPFLGVYYKNENGFMEFYIPGGNLRRHVSINYKFFKHSYLYRWFIVNLSSFLFDNSSKQKKDFRYDDGQYYMSQIKRICIAQNIPFFCVIWPYFLPSKEYKNWQKNEHKNMLKVLNILDIDYIDLHKYFSDSKRRDLRMYGDDYIHPAQKGHKIAAEAIFNYIIQEYKEFFLNMR